MNNIPTKEALRLALEERHGAELQKKFSEASVAVCGLGGLGSNIAVSLARAGVGNLHIIDFDRVDITNVNRQQYFLDQIGQFKTDALYENLMRINPYCNIKKSCIRLDSGNIPEITGDSQIICEAFDKAESKAELANCVLEKMPDKFLVCCSGMAGIGTANSIKTRRITRKFYICGDQSTDIADGQGLFSSRVAVCAAHQAHMILRIIAEEFEDNTAQK